MAAPNRGRRDRVTASQRGFQKRLSPVTFYAASPMFERPRGTNDWGPEDMAKRRFVESRFVQLAESFGFREVSTPTFESLELFTAKSGPAIVRELYAFKDQGDRDLALRPEFTASILRFYVSDLRSRPKPLKLYSTGNVFRYEEPQKGRYREFSQVNAEIIGGRGIRVPPKDRGPPRRLRRLSKGLCIRHGRRPRPGLLHRNGLRDRFPESGGGEAGRRRRGVQPRRGVRRRAHRADRFRPRPGPPRHGGGGGAGNRAPAAARRVRRADRGRGPEEGDRGPDFPPGRGPGGRHRSRRARTVKEPGLCERDRRPLCRVARGERAEGLEGDRAGHGVRRPAGGPLGGPRRGHPQPTGRPRSRTREAQAASRGNSRGTLSPTVKSGDIEP